MDHTKVQVLIPCVNDILDQLASSKVFSTIDLKISYHHIIIKSKDEQKTVFKM
jgi:hypothetical protein